MLFLQIGHSTLGPSRTEVNIKHFKAQTKCDKKNERRVFVYSMPAMHNKFLSACERQVVKISEYGNNLVIMKIVYKWLEQFKSEVESVQDITRLEKAKFITSFELQCGKIISFEGEL